MHEKVGGQTTLIDPALEKVGGQLTPLTPWFRGLCPGGSDCPEKCLAWLGGCRWPPSCPSDGTPMWINEFDFRLGRITRRAYTGKISLCKGLSTLATNCCRKRQQFVAENGNKLLPVASVDRP